MTRVIVISLVGVALGASTSTFDFAEGTAYLSDAPETCVNCHGMRPQYNSWERSRHHAVATCNGCRVPSDGLRKWMTKSATEWHHSKAFAIDFREDRGHSFRLDDQRTTERVKQRKQSGACLHGFALSRKCYSCLSTKGSEAGDAATPHLPSIERWRKGGRDANYNPNALASRQEMRALVCGQCQAEYNFTPDAKRVTYPWQYGLKVEDAERYYNTINFNDWVP